MKRFVPTQMKSNALERTLLKVLKTANNFDCFRHFGSHIPLTRCLICHLLSPPRDMVWVLISDVMFKAQTAGSV